MKRARLTAALGRGKRKEGYIRRDAIHIHWRLARIETAHVQHGRIAAVGTQTQPRQQVHGIGHGVVLVLFSVSSPSNYFNQRKIYPISFKPKQGAFISF